MPKKDENHNNQFASFIPVYEHGKLLSVTGSYVHNLSFYKFSLKRQKISNVMFRGMVSAIDKTGHVLKYVKEIKTTDKTQKNTSKEYPLSFIVRCYSADEEDLKDSIADTVIRMYRKHARVIESERDLTIRPDTITLAVAAQSYAGRYIAFAHKDAGAKYQHDLAKRIQNCCAKLPNKAMANITKKEIKQWLVEQSASREMYRLLKGFWDYCINKRICFGTNPVVIPARKKKGVKGNNEDEKIEILTIDQQDIIYDKLETESSGPDCGIALMLGGGFSPKQIVEMKWNRVEFKDDDYLIIKHYNNENAGATHNYTKPISPRAAIILNNRYKMLVDIYGDKKVQDMPISSYKKNPKSPISTDLLVKNATALLLDVCMNYDEYRHMYNSNLDIAAATRVMNRTYCDNLENICNLCDDPGALNFLEGRSLADDVTSDAYTAFTSEDGLDRLYYVQKILRKNNEIPEIPAVVDEHGKTTVVITPKYARDYYIAVIDIVVPAGKKFEVLCPHGVTDGMSVRALTESGRRRKVSK